MSLAISTSPKTLVDTFGVVTERTNRIVRDVVLVIGFAVLTAILAQVHFSLGFTPVPITGQTLGVLLSGTALGWRRGVLSMGTYWLVGIFMPIAWYAGDDSGSNISAGWHMATGTTAGYLFGFVVAAAFVGYLAERGQDRSFSTSLPAMLAGSVIIYVFGVLWLAHKLSVPVFNGEQNAVGYGLTPFLAGDLVKLCIAGVLTPAAWKFVGRKSN
ncbi:MAG: biotin transporter BioY [Actinomycetes bacterium]